MASTKSPPRSQPEPMRPVDPPAHPAYLRSRRLAISDPLRSQIHALMTGPLGPGRRRTWTAKELGTALGRTPNGLHHHLALLLAGGWIEEDGVRVVGSRRERAYRGAEEGRIWWDSDHPEDFVAWTCSMLDVGKAKIGAAIPGGHSANATVFSVLLTEDDYADLRTRVFELFDHLRERSVPPADEHADDVREVTLAVGWAALPPTPGLFEQIDRDEEDAT